MILPCIGPCSATLGSVSVNCLIRSGTLTWLTVHQISDQLCCDKNNPFYKSLVMHGNCRPLSLKSEAMVQADFTLMKI